MICRYRLKDDVAMDIVDASQIVTDDDGNRVDLRQPVTRPKVNTPNTLGIVQYTHALVVENICVHVC